MISTDQRGKLHDGMPCKYLHPPQAHCYGAAQHVEYGQKEYEYVELMESIARY